MKVTSVAPPSLPFQPLRSPPSSKVEEEDFASDREAAAERDGETREVILAADAIAVARSVARCHCIFIFPSSQTSTWRRRRGRLRLRRRRALAAASTTTTTPTDDCWTCSNDDNPAAAAANNTAGGGALASFATAVGFAMIYDKEAEEIARPSIRSVGVEERRYSFLHSLRVRPESRVPTDVSLLPPAAPGTEAHLKPPSRKTHSRLSNESIPTLRRPPRGRE